MAHWKLTLAYDGAPYRGWQIQPSRPTVQGLLADAIHRTTGERVLPQGSGRTDAGVHALAQVASFALAAPIPAANLHRALNRCLPPSIRVLAVEAVPPDFHARHSALRKTYEYRIFPLRLATNSACHSDPERSEGEESPYFVRTPGSSLDPPLNPRTQDRAPDPGPICPPTLAPYVWPCPWPLDLDALNRAARHVLGTHDFTTFAATDPDLTHRSALGSPDTTALPSDPQRVEAEPRDSRILLAAPQNQPQSSTAGPRTNIRAVTHSHWHVADGLLVYRVAADGFLHHMVRNLVGTFVQCGACRLDSGSIPALLAARNRAVAGPTAPASGLFLVSVQYSDPTPSSTEI